MRDLISRQAAIEALAKWFYEVFGIKESDGTAAIFKRLRELPSAQPEPCEDAVSRAYLLDTFKKMCDAQCPYTEKQRDVMCGAFALGDAIMALEDAPSVTPKRKKGEWIIKDNPGTGWYRVTCSECGEDVTNTAPCIGFYPNAEVTWGYCPNCGARMLKGGEAHD